MAVSLVWTILPIVVSILSFIFVFVTKWIDPNNDRVGYPFDVNRRVKDLINVLEELKEIKEDLCRLMPYSGWEHDKGWIRRVQLAITKAQRVKLLQDEHRLNLFRKCSVARKADIQAKRIQNLVTEGKRLLDIARANPLPVRYIMPQVHQPGLFGLDSTIKKVVDFVQEYNGSARDIIGICGMCGTGKSSILKVVREICVHQGSFDYVIFGVANYECSVPMLQKMILANLGMNSVIMDEESNATVIFNILKDKNFVLLLDNLWSRADLEKIGIPKLLRSRHPRNQLRHKVIFATRSLLVSADMECRDHCIMLDCLNPGDAWNLFREKVGCDIIYSDPYMHFLAKQIVDLCHGLPIAVCAVARVMSIMHDPKDWSAAVQCLKRSGLIGLLGGNNDVIHSLKVSYYQLEERVGDCFLVCSLFKKGDNIRRNTLLQWWTGLGLLDINHASARGHMIINKLLAVGLLHKGDNDHENSEYSCLKVHPILHDMAAWIVSESKKDWIPLLNFLSSSLSNWQNYRNLTFLDLSSLSSMKEFPKEICNLVKLQYLNISGTKIVSVPAELFYLSELKFLYLRQMKNLKQIPCGVIASLEKLQVLDLFSDIITIPDVSFHMLPFIESPGQTYTSKLLLELERHDMKLEEFGVCSQTMEQVNILARLPSARVRSLSIDNIQEDDSQLGEEQGKMNLKYLSQVENLSELSITRCYSIKEVVAVGEQSYGQSGLLGNLEYLCLGDVEKVIWKNAGLNLRVVCLFCCNVKHASWLQKLPCLVEVKVIRCSQMAHLVDSTTLSDDLVRDQAFITFPRLEKLTLQWLPQLCSLCDINCQVGKLRYLQVHVCTKLNSLCLHPHHNQCKIKIWCSRPWWCSLEWHSEVMKPYLRPMCNENGTSLDDQAVLSTSGTTVAN